MDNNSELNELNLKIKESRDKLANLKFEELVVKDNEKLVELRGLIVSLRKELKHLIFQKAQIENNYINDNKKGR